MTASDTVRVRSITVESAALDEFNGTMILRGVVAVESIPHLLVDDYQREELTLAQRASILDALKKGEQLPDLELAMRGERYREIESGKVRLNDAVYIVDDFQRRQTVLAYLASNPEAKVRLGVKIYFGTTKEWEKARFETLNVKRVKVAPAVMLRNLREDHPGVQVLWGLTMNERTFVMYNRVTWSQNMARGELITAGMFAKYSSVLHAHKSGVGDGTMSNLAGCLDQAVDVVGIQNVRENLRIFWGLIDECWGIQRIHQRGGASYMKGSFLHVFAKLLSDHYDFWETDDTERKLFVHAPLRQKLAKFPVNDPEVARLAGSGGKARDILYHLIRDHVDSGKRTRRLRSRYGDRVNIGDETGDVQEAA